MKKIILLFGVIAFQINFSQISFNGSKFEKDGASYKVSRYKDIFKNKEAIYYVKKARENKTAGDIFAFTGGFGIGFGLAGVLFTPNKTTYNWFYGQSSTIKNDKSGYWLIAGLGTGIALISIPFYLDANKNFKKAVAKENEKSSTTFKPYFNIESSGNTISLSYNF